MKVWMIRHGESETNRDGLWTGWLDAPLTEKGREDAASAAKLFANVQFDKVYSSDLLRARTTAEIAIPGCTYETTPLLREINVGNIAGKPLGIVASREGISWNKDGYVQFGGESRQQFADRIGAFMKRLETGDYENVAVFSHAGVVRMFLDLVLGIDVPRKNMYCGNCTVAIFEFNSSGWRLHSWINL